MPDDEILTTDDSTDDPTDELFEPDMAEPPAPMLAQYKTRKKPVNGQAGRPRADESPRDCPGHERRVIPSLTPGSTGISRMTSTQTNAHRSCGSGGGVYLNWRKI